MLFSIIKLRQAVNKLITVFFFYKRKIIAGSKNCLVLDNINVTLSGTCDTLKCDAAHTFRLCWWWVCIGRGVYGMYIKAFSKLYEVLDISTARYPDKTKFYET